MAYWTRQEAPLPKILLTKLKDYLLIFNKELIWFPEIVVMPSGPTWISSRKKRSPSLPI